MRKEMQKGISFFERYLTLWVVFCMGLGILIGKYAPSVPEFLSRFEYAKVSIPIAILIWLMIYPMMLKVDFHSIRRVGENPKGLYVTWITNWLVKPFTMFGIAYLFFFFIFRQWISPELAKEYLSGAVLLGAAPCTAMVFVWSHLTNGNWDKIITINTREYWSKLYKSRENTLRLLPDNQDSQSVLLF